MRISTAILLSIVLGMILSLSSIYYGIDIAKADSASAAISTGGGSKGNESSFLAALDRDLVGVTHKVGAIINNFTSNSFNQTSLPPLTVSPQNVSVYTDSIGSTHMVGVIVNPFTFPIQSVQVVASAHNAIHQLIRTGFTYADKPEQLRPGEKSGFDILFLPNGYNYELSASYERADTVKPPALYLYIGQSFTEPDGTHHLLGEVTNMGTIPTSSVTVDAIFYDSNDKVLDVEQTYTTPSDLQPGQKAPFDLTTSTPNSSLIRFVSWDVQSEDYSLLSSLPLMGLVGK
jgi:hypothetical protein